MSSTSANASVAHVIDQLACMDRKIAELQDLLEAIRIEASINAATDQPEDKDLVLERLPNGEYAWLKADLTAKRGPL